MIFAVIIRFAITIYTSILQAYTQEIYPTVVRDYGYGICMAVGKLGNFFKNIFSSGLRFF